MKITLTIEVDDKGIQVSSSPVTQETVTPVEVKEISTVTKEEPECDKILNKRKDRVVVSTPISPCIGELTESIKSLGTEKIEMPDISHQEWIGEVFGKGNTRVRQYQVEGRTEEYPYNVLDAKALMKKYKIGFAELAREMGGFDVIKLRNIFRNDYRRFTAKDFNVIIKAIHNILIDRNENKI